MSRAWPVEGIEPDASLARNARRILAVRIGEYYSYAPIVADQRATEELHALRISAKRLRYTLELFRAVFGEAGERLIERVKAIQEDLGNLHDADVRIALVLAELADLGVEQTEQLGQTLAQTPLDAHDAITASALRPPPDDPRRGIVALLGREYVARKGAYDAFLRRWNTDRAEGMRRELVQLSATPETALIGDGSAN